jgi:uncharacterized membrane protein
LLSRVVQRLLHLRQFFANQFVHLKKLGCAAVDANALSLAQICVVVGGGDALGVANLCQPEEFW